MKERTKWMIPRHEISHFYSANEEGQPRMCFCCEREFKLKKSAYLIDKKGKHYPLCYNCKDVQFVEARRYGFWLRFAHEHFIPCDKCQDKLEDYLFNATIWAINNDKMTVDLVVSFPKVEEEPRCYFAFRWIEPAVYWTPCKKCQEKLRDTIANANEMTVGNKDYRPPIELWRRWDIDDKRTRKLERELKRKARQQKDL